MNQPAEGENQLGNSSWPMQFPGLEFFNWNAAI